MNKIYKLPELKRIISHYIQATPLDQFPVTITFQQSFDTPTYNITMDAKISDTFVDKNGDTWVRK